MIASVRLSARRALLALGLLLVGLHAAASELAIEHATASVRNDIVMLDADARIVFSEDAIEALRSGIALHFDLEIRLMMPRRYLWDVEIYSTQRRFALERHALSNQFVLSEEITGERRIHGSLELAVEDLGRIRQLPLVEAAEIDTPATPHLALRLSLDLTALPAPMIPLAYLSPGWHMSSGWQQWPTGL